MSHFRYIWRLPAQGLRSQFSFLIVGEVLRCSPPSCRQLAPLKPASSRCSRHFSTSNYKYPDRSTVEINDVQKKIDGVQVELKELQKLIKGAADNVLSCAAPGQLYWMDEKKMLMDKEKMLMDEKKILMTHGDGLQSKFLKYIAQLFGFGVNCDGHGWDKKLLRYMLTLNPDQVATERRFMYPMKNSDVMLNTVGRVDEFSQLFFLWGMKVDKKRDQSLRYDIPAIGAPPGSGKSHLLSIAVGRGRWIDENKERVKVVDQSFETAMEGESSNMKDAIQHAIGVAITFNDRTEFLIGRENDGPENAVARRLLFTHFHRGKWEFFRDSFVKRVTNLTVEKALELILSDVDSRYPGEDRYLIIAVDELIRLAGGALDGKEGKIACSYVLSALAPLYSHPRVFFVVSSLSALVLPFSSSGRTVTYFDVPLLSADQISELASRQSNQVREKLGWPSFERLLIESAGLPRFISGLILTAEEPSITSQTTLANIREHAIVSANYTNKWPDDDAREAAMILSTVDASFFVNQRKAVDNAWKIVKGLGYAYPRRGYSDGIISPAILMYWSIAYSEKCPFIGPIATIIEADQSLQSKTQGKYFETQMAALWTLHMRVAYYLQYTVSYNALLTQFAVPVDSCTLGSLLHLPKRSGLLTEKVKVVRGLDNVFSTISMDELLDPMKHMLERCQMYLASQSDNCGFDFAAMFNKVDESSEPILVLFEMRRRRAKLSGEDIARKFCKVFAFRSGNSSFQVRKSIVSFFNSFRLVYVIGGWCNLNADVVDYNSRGEIVLSDVVVRQCVEKLNRLDIEGLEISEDRVQSAIHPISHRDIKRLLGPSLSSLASFQHEVDSPSHV